MIGARRFAQGTAAFGRWRSLSGAWMKSTTVTILHGAESHEKQDPAKKNFPQH